MRLFFRTPLILFLVATIFACGEEVDPNAPFACEIYDPSQAKKYAKPTTPEEQRQFTKCIPQDLGVVEYHPIEKPGDDCEVPKFSQNDAIKVFSDDETR